MDSVISLSVTATYFIYVTDLISDKIIINYYLNFDCYKY